MKGAILVSRDEATNEVLVQLGGKRVVRLTPSSARLLALRICLACDGGGEDAYKLGKNAVEGARKISEGAKALSALAKTVGELLGE